MPRWRTSWGSVVGFLEQLGAKPGPHAALFGPETYVQWSKEVMDMVGPEGMADWTDPEAVLGGTFEYHFRWAVASTIYGGSSEVLRSLIAEQLLGLPRSSAEVVKMHPSIWPPRQGEETVSGAGS